ncbi:MAG: TonB-dependent siderophore receptor [Paracoccus denitrificans]|uniref:TonB-dependent siderophore receptor n=1 Tax=Paracoccus denitrificans TaxID=266 RepID=A0A533I8L1_PARDE|nr:MAG: TonB-dependent siderophore receptor [Paracoccus denitrificans]
MKLTFRAVALLSASTLTLSAALAQDTTDEIVLDTITLTATTDASVQAEGFVSEYVQAATKSDTPVAEMQQSVSVVTTTQIEQQGAESLGEALTYSAGVSGQPYGADPRFDSPNIRGFEARSAQYVNGLRQLRYLGAPAYEIYGLQQVEVLKGPSSSLYGAGNPAGIINQVQKRAQDYGFGEVGVGYDSNDAGQAFFDVNRAPSDTLSWRLTGILRDDKTQIEELGNDRGYLAGALRWHPDDLTTIDVIASHTDDGPISPTGVPYDLTQIADGDYLRDLYTGNPNWDESDRKMTNFGVEISRDLDNGWTLSQGFRYEKLDWDYTNTYVSGLSGDDITLGYTDQHEDTSGISLDTRLSGLVETGTMTHNLLFGVDLRKYDAETRTEFSYGPSLNWRNPDYSDTAPSAPWYIATTDVTLTQIGVYAQDEIAAGNWRGSLTLRHDRAEQSGTQYNNFNGVTDADQVDKATTGRAGVSYVFANGVMPYLSYSTSFDPQIGTDEDGDKLKPTKAKQWELGVKYQPEGFNGLITAAIYDLKETNVTRRVVEGGRPFDRQIGEVKSRGFELEATVELAEGWDIRAGYAYNDSQQREGANDRKDMPNAPRHLASAWLSRDFGNGWQAGGGFRHIGQRYGDEANAYDLDAVTLLDMGGSYTQGNIEATLNVSNLTDETYVANCGSFGCFYGEGRTISAKIARKW